MSTADPARVIKDALAGHWASVHPGEVVTLDVDDDQAPPWLLVADDGGPNLHPGAWMLQKSMTRITIRITAAAVGRTDARARADQAVDHVIGNRPAGIARIDNRSATRLTRDRDTGAWLAWVEMPVIVRPQ
jgi:hypothetical protein